MSPHIFSTKSAPIDESAFALLRNRSAYIQQSKATVGRLPMHPPVPRDRALVPFTPAGSGAPLPVSDRPSALPAGTYFENMQ